MARDLNKFFAQHRKSHTRYISSVDSLIARYEDVGDNELDSVVDLSSFEVFKDKKDIFRRGKFVGSASHSVRSNEKCKDYTLKERIEEDESILPEEEDDSDPDSKNVDFQVLSDLSTCVASFLEEGEPEPSDAETLSSTSTDSYETILSDYDDTTQDSCSQEEDFKYTEKCGEDEHLYDEIDGDLYRQIDKDAPQNRTNQSKNTLPHLNSEFSERDERIHKNEEKRLDETFVIEDCKKSNINGTANAHNVKKCSRHVTAECNNSSTVDNYDIGHSEVTKQNSGHNVRNSSSQGINVRKILTHFTPFHEDDMDNRRGSVSGNYLNNKKELCINNEHGEDTQREIYTENSLFSEDSRCLDGNSNRIYEIQNNIQLEIDKLDTSGHFQTKG
ncbi:uncharacterized protein LOC123551506 [Mercenaria mercenaria]|uniref:uncharacterized protein LOC123551506 n=1 Tax=Mercenaria mercenaria TaxID=6596 RepID=UPI00234EDB6F|nr:uncharacterized protein LOC123551506 [Mercenaria mercenaria]